LPMPAGQAILKGGTSRQSPISVSTSGKHPKDPHFICTERRLGYRQAGKLFRLARQLFFSWFRLPRGGRSLHGA
jgi:hypothetical protein